METYAKINNTNSTLRNAKKFSGSNSFIQPKLAINNPNDAFEQETDVTADKVMRMANPNSEAVYYNSFFTASERDFLKKTNVNSLAQNAIHILNGKSNCSPTWFGDTSPEIDAQTGGFTGRLIVKYNDVELKEPCVRECVELHEQVHVQDLSPIVKKIHDCDVAAGQDWNKKEKCNEISNKELTEIAKKSECRAYSKSYTCLTLKMLNSADKCSKSPHKEEIQKHRKYEACELKQHCANADIPQAGIPNV